MRSPLVRLAALAGLLAGCDHPASPARITGPLTPSLSVEGRPVVVSGSGHIEVGDGLRNFTFHAVQHPDGSVSGSYAIYRTDLGTGFTVDVSCLSVVGNGAWVGGHIATSTQPGVVVGTVSYFYAFDNGEGGNAPPDIVSIARINDPPGRDVEFCTNRPQLLPPRVVEMGNVQIR
jgi:hypothetical protein